MIIFVVNLFPDTQIVDRKMIESGVLKSMFFEILPVPESMLDILIKFGILKIRTWLPHFCALQFRSVYNFVIFLLMQCNFPRFLFL